MCAMLRKPEVTLDDTLIKRGVMRFVHEAQTWAF
jgi:hypothetical protein